MSYQLIIMIIMAVVVVIYVWYATRGLHAIPDDKILILDTEEDRILSKWYERNISPTFNFDLNEYEVAGKYLSRLFNTEIDPNLVVIGSNLASQYRNLTNKRLLFSDTYTPHQDQLYDLRRQIGKKGEIAIIQDSQVRIIMRRNNTYDVSDLNDIMEYDLDSLIREHIKKILKYRWDKISQISDPNILNVNGSYLFLQTWNVPNVQAAKTPVGFRINLLCTDLEFETLLARWTASKAHPVKLETSTD